MIKKILALIGLILGIFVVIAALKPEDYMIKREIVINAPPDVIFPHLVNTQRADAWMPWKEIDPQVTNSYTGPAEGIGSISKWESNGRMGTGQAEVIEVMPNRSVKIKISYSKPMEMHQESEFLLTPNGESTTMAWIVTGKQTFFPRFMCTLTFMNMDSYVGGMFEKGLAKLKASLETK